MHPPRNGGRQSGENQLRSLTRRGLAIGYGVVTHLVFALGIAAMVVNLHQGMRWGLGALHGPLAVVANTLLLLQFPLVHSLLLTRRGRSLLGRVLPLGLGPDLVTTSFALVGSAQLLLTFTLWSPSGVTWWDPSGTSAWIQGTIFAGSWLFLGLALRDAGLSLHTGSLGWTAAARGRRPTYLSFAQRGLFRHVRQPVYLGFALTLWTGPVWTPDRLALALAWTLYCVAGPRLKERRYARRYGESFAVYRRRVPFMLPKTRRSLPVASEEPGSCAVGADGLP